MTDKPNWRDDPAKALEDLRGTIFALIMRHSSQDSQTEVRTSNLMIYERVASKIYMREFIRPFSDVSTETFLLSVNALLAKFKMWYGNSGISWAATQAKYQLPVESLDEGRVFYTLSDEADKYQSGIEATCHAAYIVSRLGAAYHFRRSNKIRPSSIREYEANGFNLLPFDSAKEIAQDLMATTEDMLRAIEAADRISK